MYAKTPFIVQVRVRKYAYVYDVCVFKHVGYFVGRHGVLAYTCMELTVFGSMMRLYDVHRVDNFQQFCECMRTNLPFHIQKYAYMLVKRHTKVRPCGCRLTSGVLGEKHHVTMHLLLYSLYCESIIDTDWGRVSSIYLQSHLQKILQVNPRVFIILFVYLVKVMYIYHIF